jgi:Ca2+/Na+ antiporter
MLKMISQASALALGLVTVVLVVVALAGHPELWPVAIVAAVITLVLVAVFLVDKRRQVDDK